MTWFGVLTILAKPVLKQISKEFLTFAPGMVQSPNPQTSCLYLRQNTCLVIDLSLSV